MRSILLSFFIVAAVHAQGTPQIVCSAGQAITGQYLNTGQTCGSFVTSSIFSANNLWTGVNNFEQIAIFTGPDNSVVAQFINAQVATSSLNHTSPVTQYAGNYWNGSAGSQDVWTVVNVLGTGTNPTSTFTLSHSGTSGAAAVSVPALNVTTLTTAGCVTNTSAGVLGTAPCSYKGTATIGGSLVSVGCANQTTVTITGATTAMSCVMSGATTQPSNISPQCFVSAANTVTPQLCTAIALGTTPGSQAYNIRVIP